MDQAVHVVIISFWAAIAGLIIVHAKDFGSLVGQIGNEWTALIKAIQAGG